MEEQRERLAKALARKGLSIRQTAKQSDVSDSTISLVIKGERHLSYKTAAKLAPVLNVTPGYLLEGENEPIQEKHSLESVLNEAREKYLELEVIEVPIRGKVPCGDPSLEEENIEGYIAIPKGELGNVQKGVYALLVSGDSLEGDGIHSGDLMVIDPNPEIVDGKIYVVRMGNEVVARHVYRLDDSVRLEPSNGKFHVMHVKDVEILGRVILSGQWRKH